MYDIEKRAFFSSFPILHNPKGERRKSKKVYRKLPLRKCLFSRLVVFSMREFFSLFYDARNFFLFFFAFISSSTPLFSSSMVCEWVLLNFFPRVVHCFMRYAHSYGWYFVRDRGSVMGSRVIMKKLKEIPRDDEV